MTGTRCRRPLLLIVLTAATMTSVPGCVDTEGPGSDSAHAAHRRAHGFITIDDRLAEMHDDVRRIRNVRERQDIRYISLHHLANQGYADRELAEVRDAVSFLLNSLSRSRFVERPREVGRDGLLLRIDITDYGWDGELWDEIARRYPYGVVYHRDGELFRFDEDLAQATRDEIGADLFEIQADWFLANASKAPIYNRMLGLPSTLDELAANRGVAIRRSFETASSRRLAVRQSGPSDTHRVVERIEQPGAISGFWLTYDAASTGVGGGPFDNPLSFRADGGVAMYAMDNGFFGYMTYRGDPLSAAATAIDVAPIDVLQDPGAYDGQVTNGRSCMNCHASGLIVRDDQLRRDIVRGDVVLDGDGLEHALEIYTDRAEMRGHFADDNDRYRLALDRAGVVAMNDRTMHDLHDAHALDVTLNGLAGTLGIPADDLRAALERNGDALPGEITVLRSGGATVERTFIDENFATIVDAIGLGTTLR